MSGCVQNFTHLFTPEEDSLIIELKESGKGLTWSQISEYFPDRSKGTLQVRYCRQLSKAKRWKKRARLSSRNRPRKTAAAGPKLDKHDAKIVEAVDNSAPHRMTTRSAALPTTNDQPEKTCRHAANDQPVDTAESLVTAQPMRTTKPVAKRLQLDRKKVTLVRPTPPDGKLLLSLSLLHTSLDRPGSFVGLWVLQIWMPTRNSTTLTVLGWRVIDPSDPALTENEYTPKAFLNPPANRVVEYNSRSGSFRCRTRRAEDEKQQRFRVSQQVDGNDHELDTSDTVTGTLVFWAGIQSKPAFDLYPASTKNVFCNVADLLG